VGGGGVVWHCDGMDVVNVVVVHYEDVVGGQRKISGGISVVCRSRLENVDVDVFRVGLLLRRCRLWFWWYFRRL
jgi:hypothetical protein